MKIDYISMIFMKINKTPIFFKKKPSVNLKNWLANVKNSIGLTPRISGENNKHINIKNRLLKYFYNLKISF